MNIIQLNEEISLNDGNGSAVILLVDYKNKKFDVFKTYEDKTFSSHDIQKYFDIITEAVKLGRGKLHPEIKLNGNGKHDEHEDKPLKSIVKKCKECGNEFTAYHNRTTICPDCKAKK